MHTYSNSDLTFPPGGESDVAAPLDLDRLLQSVEISTQAFAGRRRRVEASILIPASPEVIWAVLTDYEHLADFIPNLTTSRRLPHPEGGIRLEQIGGKRILKLNFSARVVLDMVESAPERIDFSMVEGDFQEFSGYWQITPQSITTSQLTYGLAVRPKRTMPTQILECRLNIDLPRNLVAIYQRSTEP